MGLNEKLWSPEAEGGVLGSILLEPRCIADILPVLDEKSFFKPEHQTIYNVLAALFISNIPIDGVSVRTELKQLNQLERIGGAEYLQRLIDTVCSSANALYYANVVKDRQRYRQLVQAVEQIKIIPDEPLSIDEQIAKIQDLALDLQQGQAARGYFNLADRVEAVVEESKAEKKAFTATGIRNIDGIIEGFGSGELVVIAGRPSMGKSALALQIALNMAKAGKSIVYITLEMSHTSLIARALKNASVEELKGVDIILNESANTPEKQIAFIKTRKQTHKVDAVFIDYLQLMCDGRKTENRVAEISAISRKLKLAAVSEGVPIVALSQLNRAVENREHHRPRMSDLRESGAIEQDADLVLLLHREDIYRRNEDPNAAQDGSAELIIAKNRRGPTGIANLIFLDARVTFADKAICWGNNK